MITKSLAKMQVTLLELRTKDLNRSDLKVRVLHSAIIIQGNLLGLLVDLLKDRYAGDGAELKAIEKILLQSQDLSAGLIRLMDKEIGPRDQAEAFIEEFKAAVASLPDPEEPG